MAYKYEHEHRNMKAGVFSGLATNESVEELQEVYRKAKAFDEVKNFTTERLKEQELTDEYDYGERFMCEKIGRLLEDE